MEVLVLGDPREQLLRDRLVGELAGVAVGDAGGELLEGDVRAHVEQRLVAGVEARLHRLHPGPLELVGVDATGDEEVVADAERVPALLRRPAVDPGAPRALPAEGPLDLAVVARQVVLGEEVDLEGGAGDLRELRLVDRPRVAAELLEVAPQRPRDVLVRHPLLGDLEVPVEVVLGDRLERREQLRGVEIGHGVLLGAGRGRGHVLRPTACTLPRDGARDACAVSRMPCPSPGQRRVQLPGVVDGQPALLAGSRRSRHPGPSAASTATAASSRSTCSSVVARPALARTAVACWNPSSDPSSSRASTRRCAQNFPARTPMPCSADRAAATRWLSRPSTVKVTTGPRSWLVAEEGVGRHAVDGAQARRGDARSAWPRAPRWRTGARGSSRTRPRGRRRRARWGYRPRAEPAR